MSYKERLARLEAILQINKLSLSSPRKRNHHDNSSSNNEDNCNQLPDDDDDLKIDLDELKQLVFHGLPGDNRHRPLVWRLLLNYLPPSSTQSWEGHLAKKRSHYKHFVEDLLMLEGGGCTTSSLLDHPLNPEPDSKWQVFFKDNDVLLQIDKDVRRLCPEMSFFQSPTPYPNEHIISGRMERLHKRVQSSVLQSSSVIRKGLGVTKMTMIKGSGTSGSSSNNNITQDNFSSEENDLEPSGGGLIKQATADRSNPPDGTKLAATTKQPPETECHWEVVERILFLYAKLNPGQSYVQGMNEIIGPIYYTLANDNNNDQQGASTGGDRYKWREHAEADTFYLFTNLMGEIRDFFIRSLDQSVSGIGRMMEVLMRRLEGRDPEVFGRVVRELEIVPQYYAFRWITLLMSQEFPLPDVLRIWDTLLSDPNRFDFLIDLACAMIIHIRSDLLTGDFPTNMKLLQNYTPIDVRDILSLASSYRQPKSRVGLDEEEDDDKKTTGNNVDDSS